MNTRTERNRAADELLAGLTIPQIEAGVSRALKQLALIDGLEASEDFEIGHPSRHATAAYVGWSEAQYSQHRAMLNSALADCRNELARRGVA